MAGTERADPVGMILSGAMLLRHLGETDASDRVEAAVADVLREGVAVTPDLRAPDDDRSTVGTGAMAEAIAARLSAP